MERFHRVAVYPPRGTSCRASCIGDEIRDYEAATTVGMLFGAVAWGYTTIAALRACAPAAVFHQIEDIVGHLAGNDVEP
jgi:phosphoglycolate phosphatase